MIDIDKHLTSYHDGGNDYRYAFSKEEVAEIKQALEFYESALKNEDGYLSAMCERKECNNGWIACSERLPEDGTDVLVQFEYYRYGNYNRLFQTIGISYTYNGEWSGFVNGSSGWNDLRIIAWQPLPQPYKERD